MHEEAFVRERIRKAREEKGLSQRDMAKLYGVTQATISDIERGRVKVTTGQLMRFAEILQKPISYFFPGGIGEDISMDEAELLNLFRSLPESWRIRALGSMRREVTLYERIQPI